MNVRQMMNAISAEDRAALAAIRGKFAEPKKDTIKALTFAYLFLLGCPAAFSVALLRNGWPGFPWSPDQWALAIMIPVSVALGEFLRRSVGKSYVFDGDSVRQFSRTGRLLKTIRILDIVELTIEHSQASSMFLRTERCAMAVLLTPDLRREFEKKANQASETTRGS